MRDIQLPGRSVVMSTQGMVATSHPMATEVGVDILKRGGNAMDAAIAASATLCVTEPQSTGIGGDCFILYHEVKTGKLHGFNGSGRAPARATPEEYRARGLEAVPERGILSVTVPGAIDAWDQAMQRFGTLGLETVLQPAISFAEEGYAVTPVVALFWKMNQELLAANGPAQDAMLVNGRAPAAGTIHRQPKLAQTLRKIAQYGRQIFYEGALADAIVRYSKSQDGLFEREDFAAYHGDWVDPISTDYKGLTLYELPPNGQGITALMTLNILENMGLGELRHLGPDYLHTFVEAYRLAMAERDAFVADRDFSDVPISAMLDKAFAKRQMRRINPSRALAHPLRCTLPEHKDTIYLTVVDRDRNAVSFINSLFYGYGSGVMAGDTGIMLQNRGRGFVLEAGHPNCIAPRKRPFHTIIPAMVYQGSRPVLSYGVMGGFYQPMGHAYVLSNWLDFGMDLQEAIDAPRFLPNHLTGTLAVERGIVPETCRALEQRGHVIEQAEVPFGGGQAIFIDGDSGVLHGASDPRKDGCALGY